MRKQTLFQWTARHAADGSFLVQHRAESSVVPDPDAALAGRSSQMWRQVARIAF